jgi:hypothetical protein
VKVCRLCGVEKPLDVFYRAAGMRDGLRSECKACNLAIRAEKNAANPQPNRDRVKRWQQANRDKYLAKQREYVESGRKAIANRKSHLKRKYGLTVEQYDQMLEAQGRSCAICGRPQPTWTSLHVDHDHETGRVRGLLCFRCNNAIGDLDDSPDRFVLVAEYLERDDELAALARERAIALKA